MEVSSRIKEKDTDDVLRARYQITDVTRPLNSVTRVSDQGNNVQFTQTGGWIMNHETGRYTWCLREHGVGLSVGPLWSSERCTA